MHLTFYPPLDVTNTISLHEVPGEQFKLYVTLHVDDYLSIRRSGARIEVWTNMPIDEQANTSRWAGIPFEVDCPPGYESTLDSERFEGGKDSILWPRVAHGGSDMQITLSAILNLPTVESEYAYTFRIVWPSGIQWLGTNKTNGILVFKKDELESSTIEKPPASNWDLVYEDSSATVLSSASSAQDSTTGNTYSLGKTFRVFPTSFDPSRIFHLPLSIIRQVQRSSPSLVIYSHHHEARFLHREDTDPISIGLRSAGVEFSVLPTHVLRSEDEEKAEAWNISIIHPSSYHSTLTHVMSESPAPPQNGYANGDAAHPTDVTSTDRSDSSANLQRSQYLALLETIPMIQRLLSLLLLYIIRLGILSGLPWLWGPVSSDPYSRSSTPFSKPPPFQDYKPTAVRPPTDTASTTTVQRRLPRLTFVFPWWTSSEGVRFILHPPTSSVDSFQDIGVRVGDDKVALSRANVGVRVEKLTGMDGWMVAIDGTESDVGRRLEIGLKS